MGKRNPMAIAIGNDLRRNRHNLPDEQWVDALLQIIAGRALVLGWHCLSVPALRRPVAAWILVWLGILSAGTSTVGLGNGWITAKALFEFRQSIDVDWLAANDFWTSGLPPAYGME